MKIQDRQNTSDYYFLKKENVSIVTLKIKKYEFEFNYIKFHSIFFIVISVKNIKTSNLLEQTMQDKIYV